MNSVYIFVDSVDRARAAVYTAVNKNIIMSHLISEKEFDIIHTTSYKRSM